MKKKNEEYIRNLLERFPTLTNVKEEFVHAYEIMESTYEEGGKIIIAGNGGSAADSEHIVGELMKSFQISRKIPQDFVDRLEKIDLVRGKELAIKLEQPLRAISLVTHEALTTAYINDIGGTGGFAQQLYGYGESGDVFLGISTSGNSENILNAVVVAKAMGIKTIGLTGNDGGELAQMADVAIIVPEKETYKIQELHLPIYHCWCQMLEERFFGE